MDTLALALALAPSPLPTSVASKEVSMEQRTWHSETRRRDEDGMKRRGRYPATACQRNSSTKPKGCAMNGHCDRETDQWGEASLAQESAARGGPGRA